MSAMSRAIQAMRDGGLECDGAPLGHEGMGARPCQHAYPVYGGELDEILIECALADGKGGDIEDCPRSSGGGKA